MCKRTLGCAICAVFVFVVAAGSGGAAQEPESVAETLAPSAAMDKTVGTDADVDIVAGPVSREVKQGSFGRSISTYYCRTVRVARVQRTFLGFVAYKFWQRKRWCWRYPRILSREVSTFVTDVDPNFQYKGLISAWGSWYIWCCGNPYSGQTSFRQARFTNCVFRFGCLGGSYPWVRINSRGNGSFTYSTGT